MLLGNKYYIIKEQPEATLDLYKLIQKRSGNKQIRMVQIIFYASQLEYVNMLIPFWSQKVWN